MTPAKPSLLAPFAALLSASTLFTLSLVLPLPLPWYLPVERTWVWGVAVEGLGMDFYGRVALAFTVGAVVYGCLRAVEGWRGGLPRGGALLIGAWGLTATFLGGIVISILLWTRVLPLP